MHVIEGPIGTRAAIPLHHILLAAVSIGSAVGRCQEGEAPQAVAACGVEAGKPAAGNNRTPCGGTGAGNGDVVGGDAGLTAHVVLDTNAAQAGQAGCAAAG